MSMYGVNGGKICNGFNALSTLKIYLKKYGNLTTVFLTHCGIVQSNILFFAWICLSLGDQLIDIPAYLGKSFDFYT